jgi:hypothetical protein
VLALDAGPKGADRYGSDERGMLARSTLRTIGRRCHARKVTGRDPGRSRRQAATHAACPRGRPG